jgi:hypothetical protein
MMSKHRLFLEKRGHHRKTRQGTPESQTPESGITLGLLATRMSRNGREDPKKKTVVWSRQRRTGSVALR